MGIYRSTFASGVVDSSSTDFGLWDSSGWGIVRSPGRNPQTEVCATGLCEKCGLDSRGSPAETGRRRYSTFAAMGSMRRTWMVCVWGSRVPVIFTFCPA